MAFEPVQVGSEVLNTSQCNFDDLQYERLDGLGLGFHKLYVSALPNQPLVIA